MTKCQFMLNSTQKDQPYYVPDNIFGGTCSNEIEEGSDYCKQHTKKCDVCHGFVWGMCFEGKECKRDYCEKCGCLTHGVEI